MNIFDHSILIFLNSLINLHPHLDVLIVELHTNDLLANGLLVAGWWYCWFNTDRPVAHEKLIAGLLITFVAIATCQLAQHIFPPRVRPFSNPDLHFIMPA